MAINGTPSYQIPNGTDPTKPFTFLNINNTIKLTPTNYLSWKMQIEAILIGHDLYKFVDGSLPCPSPTLTTNGVEASNPEFSFWTRQDKLLFGSLVGTLSLTLVPLVSQARSTKDMWDILAKTYALPILFPIYNIMEAQTERSPQLLTAKLYDAALKGDVPSLFNLLRDDPLTLDRCIIEKSNNFKQSPLHVAANLGHSEFSKEILSLKPELAEELDQSKRWSPLHIASAKGNLEIVNTLLAVNPNMCFACDQDGRNPVHVAALNGKVQVLEVLLQAKLQAGRERTNGGETVLHLCVKHGCLESLELLIRAMADGQLLNSKDRDGNTILHLAVAAKQYETIKFLLKDKRMEKNAINIAGLTAMDTHNQGRNDARNGEIWLALTRAKVSTAKDLLKPRKSSRDWLDKQRNALMVVSSLIATMAFQAGINPPGGVWQDDSNGYKAGTSVMARVKDGQQENEMFDAFLVSNTIGLVSSLTVIILLISGLPCLRLFMGILMIIMWIAVTATTVTYLVSVYFLVYSEENFISAIKDLLTFRKDPLTFRKDHSVQRIIAYVSLTWMFLLGLLTLVHVLRLFAKLIMRIVRLVIKGVRSCYPRVKYRAPV